MLYWSALVVDQPSTIRAQRSFIRVKLRVEIKLSLPFPGADFQSPYRVECPDAGTKGRHGSRRGPKACHKPRPQGRNAGTNKRFIEIREPSEGM